MTNSSIVNLLVVAGMTLREAVEAVGYDAGVTDAVSYTEEEAEYAYAQQFAYDYATLKNMTDEERRALNKVLEHAMETEDGLAYDFAYASWSMLYSIEDEEYYERNIESFRKWEEEHILSRSYDEITADDWGFYSDWHKDMYGYRPHGLLTQKREQEQMDYLLNEGWIIDDHRDQSDDIDMTDFWTF